MEGVVTFHLIGGPEDGDTPNVEARKLTHGKIMELSLPAHACGNHVYRSLAPWSGCDQVRLHYQGLIYADGA